MPAADLIAGGTVIRMQFGPEGQRWWIDDPFEELAPDRVAALGNRLIEAGDNLFGWRGFSQTWTVAED